MNRKGINDDEVNQILDTSVVVVERRENLLLCESDTKKGWIFYGVDRNGIAEGGFCYPTLRCASYGFTSQNKISWSLPPLDFGWERNSSDRGYDLAALCLLHELYSEGAVVVDEGNEIHQSVQRLIHQSTDDELHALVQHIAPVIEQHEVPELVC